MEINWRNIRSFANSKNLGFEELCCQLAHYEDYPDDASFTRRGTPDQGIECLWTLSNGTIHAWQAKYFFEIGDSQWGNIDKSVKEALQKHQSLKKYIVCLPTDLSTTGDGKKWSQMRRWNAHVEKWKKWASALNVEVAFDFWGSHELSLRLTKEKHAGRRYYWFRQYEFSQEWFKNHIQETTTRAEPRFSSELNLKTEIDASFHAIGRTPEFIDKIRSAFLGIRREWQLGYWGLGSTESLASYNGKIEQLESVLNTISSELDNLTLDCTCLLPLEKLSEKSRAAAEIAFEAVQFYESQPQREEPNHSFNTTRRDGVGRLYALSDYLYEYSAEMERYENALANAPFLFLTGKAGEGKTHSLVDFAINQSQSFAPVVFIFGHRLGSNDIWSQITKQLHLNCNRDEFLGAMDAASEKAGRRGFIIIDAINEGSGRDVWRDELPAMVEVVKRFPNLGVIVSCRTSYLPLTERDDLVPKYMLRVEHAGFVGVELQALREFFSYYGCELPAMPMLLPEFRNPLFLKILCKAMAKKSDRSISTLSVAEVFNVFLNSVDDKLSNPAHMDYRKGTRLVHQAVKQLADRMDMQRKAVAIDIAEEICQGVLQTQGYANSLLANLISEGVLWKDIGFDADNQPEEIVMFSYERFADYMLAIHLLEGITGENVVTEINNRAQIAEMLKSTHLSQHYAGIVHAIAILLPQQAGVEISDIAAESRVTKESFLQSLTWRTYSSISDRTKGILGELLNDEKWCDQALSAYLDVAIIPGHPLNADSLDQYLRSLPMADRDAVWSIFLSRCSIKGSVVDQLLSWAWPSDDCVYKDEVLADRESMRLATKTLFWFLTTSDRFVRDRATKGLVNLIRQSNVDLACSSFEQFSEIDDPYITERLYAVLYGLVMHLEDNAAIEKIARLVFEKQFANNASTPHILLRDYARGIIEYASAKGLISDLPVKNCRPPYKSDWPLEPHSFHELQSRFDRSAFWNLTSSLGDMGDFYCYSMNAVGYWSSYPLGKRPQEEARWENSFSKEDVRGWILKQVLGMGWTLERFAKFDSNLPHPSDGRTSHKAERIGKKYQWIALHKFLAHLSDNCEYGGIYSNGDTQYEGPWQFNGRDIDPCLLLRQSHDRPYCSDDVSWWSPSRYDFSAADSMAHHEWLRDDSLHINPINFIESQCPDNKQGWFNLSSYARWYEPVAKHVHRDDVDKRQYGFNVHGFIVPEDRWPEMLAWLSSDEQHEWDVPNAYGTLEIYLGEYSWAPSMGDWSQDYPWNTDEQEWEGHRRYTSPVPVAIPETDFTWERGYDCSWDETFRGFVPARWLVDRMELSWDKKALDYVDKEGNKFTFDPSIKSQGPAALLCHRQVLEDFLQKEQLKLFWRVTSEKLIIEKKRNEDSESWPGSVINYWICSLESGNVRLRHRQAVHTTVGPTKEVFINQAYE